MFVLLILERNRKNTSSTQAEKYNNNKDVYNVRMLLKFGDNGGHLKGLQARSIEHMNDKPISR